MRVRELKTLRKFPMADKIAAAVVQNRDLPLDGAMARRRGDGWAVYGFGPGWTYETEAEVREALKDGHGEALIWRRLRRRARGEGYLPDLLTRPAAARDGRTAEALRLLAANPMLLPVEAARQAGVDPSAVYRALRRTERKHPTCPHCGKPVVLRDEGPPLV
jgi:hypothetical protein